MKRPYTLLSTNHKRNQVTSNGLKRPQTTPKEPFAVVEDVTETFKSIPNKKSRLKGGSLMEIVDGFCDQTKKEKKSGSVNGTSNENYLQ